MKKFISYQLIIALIVASQNVSGQVDNLNSISKFKLLTNHQLYFKSIVLDQSDTLFGKAPSKTIKKYTVKDTSLLSSLSIKFKDGTLYFYNDQLYKIDFSIMDDKSDFKELYDLDISESQNLKRKLIEILGKDYSENNTENWLFKEFYTTWSGSKNEVTLLVSMNDKKVWTHLILVDKSLEKLAKLSEF